MKATSFAVVLFAAIAVAAPTPSPVEYAAETTAATGTDDVACWMDWAVDKVRRSMNALGIHSN
jgi:hypothetical protein